MKLGTLKIIVNMFNVASSDPTRHYLNCVHLVQSGDTLKLRATDGHIAMRVSVQDLIPFPELHIEKDQVKALQSFIKEHGRYVADNLELDIFKMATGDETYIKSSVTGAIVKLSKGSIKYPKIDEFYPKEDKVIDIQEGVRFSVRLNPKLIEKLHKSMGSPKGGIKFTFLDNIGAVLVSGDVDGVQYDGLLMPMRL